MLCINGDNCFRVLDNPKLVLFYFTANWCGPCQKISPMVEELSKTLSDKIDFFKIQIDDDENEEICEKCEIKSVPTFILFKERSSLGIINGDINKLIILIKHNISN